MNKILKTENGKIYQMNTLADTVVFMESDDHKDRFKAEYWQLRFRFNRLKTLLSEPSKTGDFGIATPILVRSPSGPYGEIINFVRNTGDN